MSTLPKTSPRVIVTAVLGGAITLCGLFAWLGGHGASALPGPVTSASPTTLAVGLRGDPADAPVRREATLRDGWYQAPVGTALTSALTGRFEYAVLQADGSRQASGFQVRSELDLLVAARRDDAILVQVELRGFSLSPLAGGAGDDAGGLGQAARKAFQARLGTDGTVRGYRFAADLTAEQRNFVRGLFSAYMHAVPADAQGTWEASDVDAAGAFVARFRLEENSDADTACVERQKLRYTAMAGTELHPHELSGQSRATFSRALGWLRAVAVDERAILRVPDFGLGIEVRTVLDIALQTQEVRAIDLATAAWDERWLPAAGHTEDLGADAEAQERARWSEALANESLSSLMDALALLLQAKPQDPEAIDKVWVALQWLVRLRPETAGEIQQRVTAGLDAHLGRMLLSALGAAGTDPAQTALAALRSDSALPADVRSAATMALFQLAQPNERVLGDLTQDLGRAAEFTGDDALAMLLLGALAPRAGEVRVEGRAPMDVLLALEGRAQQQGRLDLWLDALGNTGTADVVPHAQRMAAHGDEAVRAAAYHAVRRVEVPAALALLERGLSDPSPRVRGDVVAALSQHQSEAAAAALIRAARDDADADVRRASVGALARFAKPGTAARQAIERAAQSDPDAGNREAARGFLAGL